MTRVLVTGGAGFLGRHLAGALTARGHAVAALDLAFDPPLDPAVETVVGSVADRGAVARAMEGCGAVLHCAALTGLWARDPGAFDRVNVDGTRIVLDAAHAAGARAVHVSSFVTLIAGGRGRRVETVDERLELPVEAMLGPYPRSKRRAELLCRAHPANPVIALPTAPIGPGDYARTPPMRMLDGMLKGTLPALIDCTWNFVDVRDLASGVIAAMERGRAGRRYLLGGANATTAEMAALFTRVAPRPAPALRVPYRAAWAAACIEAAFGAVRPPSAPLTGVRLAGPARRFDSSRACAELGHAARDPEETFRDAVAWLTRAGRLSARLPPGGESRISRLP